MWQPVEGGGFNNQPQNGPSGWGGGTYNWDQNQSSYGPYRTGYAW